MKCLKILPAVVALGILASCNNSIVEPDNPYGISVVSGEISVPSEFSINEEVFREFVTGFGWKLKDSHEILEDGSISEYPYWLPDGVHPLLGGNRNHKYYIEENKLTGYYDYDPYGIPEHTYHTYGFSFRDSSIFQYEDQEAPDKAQIQLMKILEANENEMTCIEYMAYRDSKSVYALNVYERMSEEELQYYRENYITPHANSVQ